MSEICRGCGARSLHRVLDLGHVPPAKHFPPLTAPVSVSEAEFPLAMDLCTCCGLAQLADDDTISDEPRGLEPQALKDQAADAMALVGAAGWLRGSTVREFGSPHGGTWLPLLTERGFRTTTGPADVVLDSFGIMHDPDQHAAFGRRAEATAPDGVLLLHYHSLHTIVVREQWNSLRDGHFAYYSMTALARLLSAANMSVVTAWEFDLYGGTVLAAAVHGTDVPADGSVQRILGYETALGITNPTVVGGLQRSADRHVEKLRAWLESERDAGHAVMAYGAASRAVSLFSRAGLNCELIKAVADASPAKQGRRMPGTDIPIVSPDDMLATQPDLILLTLPDLLAEVSAQYPELDGRWRIEAQ
ncbi:class I SAM-dependent methyltransferase [Mycolicibacterium vaccae]|uniref:class I SAM-dependent methyltransferase n=1 Tax=Mycolicibacterium vaccae TaxID=1810 RepID=UPI003D035D9F